jgi:hypothetical protein
MGAFLLGLCLGFLFSDAVGVLFSLFCSISISIKKNKIKKGICASRQGRAGKEF